MTNAARQIAQHQSRIRQLKRDAVFGGLFLVLLLALVVCAFRFDWHILAKVALLLPAFGMLMHAAAPYTRIADHRRKIAALEAERNEAHHHPRP
jgi:hypothetical protein